MLIAGRWRREGLEGRLFGRPTDAGRALGNHNQTAPRRGKGDTRQQWRRGFAFKATPASEDQTPASECPQADARALCSPDGTRQLGDIGLDPEQVRQCARDCQPKLGAGTEAGVGRECTVHDDVERRWRVRDTRGSAPRTRVLWRLRPRTRCRADRSPRPRRAASAPAQPVPIPPNHRPRLAAEVEDAEVQARRRFDEDTASARFVTRPLGRRVRCGYSRSSRPSPRVARPGRLVHDDLQARELADDELAVEQVQPGGVDSGLEHGVPRARLKPMNSRHTPRWTTARLDP